MPSLTKRVDALTVRDFEVSPVWKYTNDDEELDGVGVRPVKRLPVERLAGCLIGTRVRLANGHEAWALIGNVEERDPRSTQHFLVLSVWRDGRWFALARYHDHDLHQHGSEALAAFLELRLDEVFPISYDLRPFCRGEWTALVGTIEATPREKLSRAQLIALAVP